MALPHRGRWPEFDVLGTSPSRSDFAHPQFARRVLATARAVCTPGNLVLAGTLAFGWLALIGWTGAGPESWQARVCADLDRQPRACAVVQGAGAPDSAS
ncbi:hypothetical protein [Methylobacterium sp. J-090]|uniref:hypothetical protein n=1 Tax=Methylobacterium sp. J-090 TaxID=2836666 RepID=UPI001FB9F63C|nr:hypothetical protein [Methylobacterium sp. J-090]MCJ2080367.1 hypothetical protein [Methylobacterium sp. J-090]